MRVLGPFSMSMAAGAVGFLAVWLYLRSTREDAGALVSARTEARIQQVARDESLSSSDEPLLERPDARVPVTAETNPASGTDVVTADAADAPVDPRTLPEVTVDEMRRKRDAIAELLNQRSQPILTQRFENGLLEHVSNATVWVSDDPDTERTQIYAIRTVPGQGIDRTVLPREEFPELYALKDDTLRLEELISAEEVRIAREAAPPQ